MNLPTRKRLETRLSAWWSAWKYVAILAVVCALSLWGNVHQWKKALGAKDRAEIGALNDAIDKVNGIAERKTRDDAETQQRFAKIADQSELALRRYSKAATSKPLPQECAPGVERVEAINAGMGPQQ